MRTWIAIALTTLAALAGLTSAKGPKLSDGRSECATQAPRWQRWAMSLNCLLPAAMMMVLATPTAFSLPILMTPPVISGVGEDVRVIYVFASAGDQSQAFLLGSPDTSLFLNNDAQYRPGYTVDLGVPVDPLIFGLDNLTTGTTFLANVADPNGYFYALYTTDLTRIVSGALDPAVVSVLSSLTSTTPVLYIGFEDLLKRQGADFDYNDLVIAVTNVDPPSAPVPEPNSLALLGIALLGIGIFWRNHP